MQVIVRPRQGGKTIEALRLAARHFACIVVATRQEGDELAATARQLQLNIPQPITWDQFMSGRYSGRGVNPFVVDNIDRCVQQGAIAEVVGVTLTDTPETAIAPGDVDRYGRKHFRVTVDGQAYTGWLEPAEDF